MAKKTWIEEQAAIEVKNRLYGGSEIRHNLKTLGRWTAYAAGIAALAVVVFVVRAVFPPSSDVSLFEAAVVLGGIFAIATIVTMSRSIEGLKREVAALRAEVRSAPLGRDRSGY